MLMTTGLREVAVACKCRPQDTVTLWGSPTLEPTSYPRNARFRFAVAVSEKPGESEADWWRSGRFTVRDVTKGRGRIVPTSEASWTGTGNYRVVDFGTKAPLEPGRYEVAATGPGGASRTTTVDVGSETDTTPPEWRGPKSATVYDWT
jgi:hypothetical protein